jgi:rhodanese-related sulfurtransferase
MNTVEKRLLKTASPAEASAAVAGNGLAMLMDVRTPAEFAGGHAPGARLLPLGNLDARSLAWDRDVRGKRVYVMCQSGARAVRAISQLEGAGLRDCVLVEGGMDAWERAGLPVARERNRGLPILRQVQIVVGAFCVVSATLALTVDRRFAGIPLMLGGGLLFAGLTGTCGLALLLARMPWNRLAPGCAATCGKSQEAGGL